MGNNEHLLASLSGDTIVLAYPDLAVAGLRALLGCVDANRINSVPLVLEKVRCLESPSNFLSIVPDDVMASLGLIRNCPIQLVQLYEDPEKQRKLNVSFIIINHRFPSDEAVTLADALTDFLASTARVLQLVIPAAVHFSKDIAQPVPRRKAAVAFYSNGQSLGSRSRMLPEERSDDTVLSDLRKMGCPAFPEDAPLGDDFLYSLLLCSDVSRIPTTAILAEGFLPKSPLPIPLGEERAGPVDGSYEAICTLAELLSQTVLKDWASGVDRATKIPIDLPNIRQTKNLEDLLYN